MITFGLAGFEAYARLRFIPDPTGPGQKEADVHLPDDHRSDIEQPRLALHLLAASTSTAQECCFCLWEGCSDASLRGRCSAGGWSRCPTAATAYFAVPLADIDAWVADLVGGQIIAPPAFGWPADHRWCFASDVDRHWAGIGAERTAIDMLIADSQHDVVPANTTFNQPQYR